MIWTIGQYSKMHRAIISNNSMLMGHYTTPENDINDKFHTKLRGDGLCGATEVSVKGGTRL